MKNSKKLSSMYCTESPGCICSKCLYYNSSRCEGKCDEQKCCGGIFYQAHECERFVMYDESKTVVKDCLVAVNDIYQDGYISCSFIENVGCEECYRRFENKEVV